MSNSHYTVTDAVRIEYDQHAIQHGLLPIKVTEYYKQLVAEEVTGLGSTGGPLYRLVYPVPDRFGKQVPGEARDFVDDHKNMVPMLNGRGIRKYGNRLLLILTDHCAGHCLYCFRGDLLTHSHLSPNKAFDSSALGQFLQENPGIQEVILSGGDPLAAPRHTLEETLRIITSSEPARDIRIHSRNLAFSPHQFTDNLCHLLAFHKVRLVHHIVHPYEITSDAEKAVMRLRSHGVRSYAQFPLLRKTNDSPEVLQKLLKRLDELWIRPLSIFFPDPVTYSAPYRVSLRRAFSIMDQVNRESSSWINSVRWVLDTPIGKVRREDIVEWHGNVVVFKRGQDKVSYTDLPSELDDPGTESTMLWKG